MVLEGKDLDAKLSQICHSYSRIEIAGSFYYLKELSGVNNYYVEEIYRWELNKALGEGVISEEDLAAINHESESWTYEDEAGLQKLKKEVYDLEREVYFTEPVAKAKNDYGRLKRRLANQKVMLEKEWGRRYNLFIGCAESHADLISRKFTAMFALHNLDWSKYWGCEADFIGDKDIPFINKVIARYNELFFCDEISMRKLARHPQWRFKWNMGRENVAGLFGGNTNDMTNQQSMLIYWSQTYDAVYDSMERPTKRVIENDILLDKWFEEQNKKAERRTIERQYGVDGKTGKPNQRQSLMVMAKSQAEADEIYKLNDGNAVRDVTSAITQAGRAAERNLMKGKNG